MKYSSIFTDSSKRPHFHRPHPVRDSCSEADCRYLFWLYIRIPSSSCLFISLSLCSLTVGCVGVNFNDFLHVMFPWDVPDFFFGQSSLRLSILQLFIIVITLWESWPSLVEVICPHISLVMISAMEPYSFYNTFLFLPLTMPSLL